MRVMIISTVGLIYDGITNVILSNLKAMDRDNLDIYIAETCNVEESIRDQFVSLGCTMVGLPDRKKDTVRYFMSLKRFIAHNGIEVVHANGNSATLAIEMLAAWLGRCKKRIAHSHNTKCDQVRADKLLRPIFYHLYTEALACSDNAGRWLFRGREFSVLNNGRDTDAFRYDPELRNRMRKQLGLDDEIAIAHVGGFVPQKNHVFLIEIFGEIIQSNRKVKFFLIGDGCFKPDIEELVRRQGIADKVIFTGNVDNVSDFLQAFDVMLLPSLFEGLPLVVIEWQLCGLPCIVSDVVTRDCVISDNIEFCSLDIPARKWAEKAVSLANIDDRRSVSEKAVINAKAKGFDIYDNASMLREIYLK